MSTKILQGQISNSQLLPQIPKLKHTLITPSSLNPNPTFKYPKFKLCSSGYVSNNFIRAAVEEQGSILVEEDNHNIALIKSNIYQAVEGLNRGVFGVTNEKREEIEDLVMKLESQNPTPNPTLNMEKIIDPAEGKAVNTIKFNARGLKLLNGQLKIQASFSIASPSRVNIKYENSHITPDQLMNLFKKNYDLLLSIFNPDGWLDITYVDDTMRIGRDDKGNIFILERLT